jgi:hypothetical protein
MDDSNQKKKAGKRESALEIDASAAEEIAEKKRIETEARVQRIRLQAQEKNANREQMQAAMAEKAQSAAKWRKNRSQGLFFLAAVLLFYLLSLATKDRTNFNDGIKILKSGAWQLFVIVVVASIVHFVLGKLSAKRRELFDRLGLLVFLGMVIIAVIFLRGVIGLVYKIDSRGGASGLALWFSKEFLFTLALQVCLGFGFFSLRKKILKQLELGEPVVVGARSLVVLCEGIQFYLWLGVFLQVVFQVHTVALYGMMFSGPALSFLFLIPLLGYFFIRKYLLTVS